MGQVTFNCRRSGQPHEQVDHLDPGQCGRRGSGSCRSNRNDRAALRGESPQLLRMYTSNPRHNLISRDFREQSSPQLEDTLWGYVGAILTTT